MTPAAVIFDCDGVVVDSEPLAFDLLGRDLAEHGLSLTHAELEHHLLGQTMANVRLRANQLGAELDAGWVERFYGKLYTALAKGVPLMPGILDLLDRLEAADIPFALGSNGSHRKIEITLGQYPGLLARFRGGIWSGQDMPRPKPFPDLYLHAAAAMGVAPQSCVVVEDSPTGAQAAREAGMRCYGLSPKANGKLAAAGAVVIGTLAELPQLLQLA